MIDNRHEFTENGYVGIKDPAGNVLISPSRKYTSIIERKDENVAMACKNGKWALVSRRGHPLCKFIYDEISPTGEHYFCGGIDTPGVSDGSVENVYNTGMAYALLNEKGKVLFDCNKMYHFIGDLCEGQLTACYKGKAGIVDLKGNVVMPFDYKYIWHLGEGLYCVEYVGTDELYATVIDRNGNEVITPEMGYRHIGKFHDHIACAIRNGAWGLIDTQGKPISAFDYSYVTEAGYGYYRVEKGTRSNIMASDGSIVLDTWHHRVGRILEGFFAYGDTIRKSRTNPQTRYIDGLAHVSGAIIYPMIFDHVGYLDDCFYARKGEDEYYLHLDGGIYDPLLEHLPPRRKYDDEGNIVEFGPFPWYGVKNSICEGCYFADTIVPGGKGCKELDRRAYRWRYFKGQCDHRKTAADEQSFYDRQKQRKDELDTFKAETTSNVFALRTLRNFIDEKLDGNIDNLATFDLSSIVKDEKYGGQMMARTYIAWSIMSLAFGDVWPELSVDTFKGYRYTIDTICQTNYPLGCNMTTYFKGMETFSPSDELVKRAFDCYHLCHTVGNLVIWPGKVYEKVNMAMHHSSYHFHGYMDQFLIAFREALLNQGPHDYTMGGLLKKNRLAMAKYQRERGFTRLMHALMLDPFIDENGRPKHIFTGLWCHRKDLDRDSYLAAVDQFITFASSFIPTRAALIIDRLKLILSTNP